MRERLRDARPELADKFRTAGFEVDSVGTGPRGSGDFVSKPLFMVR